MSHQTGISASPQLLDLFSKSKDGSVRLIQVLISDELLVPGIQSPPQGSWEDDYDVSVLPLLSRQPCYLLYRLDSTNNQGPQWILIAWMPENCTIRQKMLYAATRATLKTEFGGGHILEELSASEKEDASLHGYRQHLASAAAPAPLSAAEIELQKMKIDEINTDVTMDTKRPTLQGVAFPIEDPALEAMRNLKEGKIQYVQLRLDIDRELVTLVCARQIEVGSLPEQVPTDSPSWNFFLYKHSHLGQTEESLVFIYSMPGSKCSIKERMLYSSCKGAFICDVEQQVGLQIARKVEVDNGSELTPDFLYSELHPARHTPRPAFDKPPGPSRSRAGQKRLVRPAPDGGQTQV